MLRRPRPGSLLHLGLCTVFIALTACGGGGGGGAIPPSSGMGSSGSSGSSGSGSGSSGSSSTPTPSPAPGATQTPTPTATFTPQSLPVVSDGSASTRGVFLGAACGQNAAVSCQAFATTFRHGIALGTVYAGWDNDLGTYLRGTGILNWPQEGLTPDITWQPTPGITYSAIASGAYDTYLTTSANELKAFGSTVFIRPFHEFNGNWYPWGLANQGASAATDTAFIAAWQHMHNIFAQQGATNVKFVWCFSSSGLYANQAWNNPAAVYPGDAYVDWVSFDAYNRGSAASGAWSSFDSIIKSAYALAYSIAPTKPILIAEIASNEYGDGGARKAAWIGQMLSELHLGGGADPYPNVRAISWFESDVKSFLYDSKSSSPVYQAWVQGIRATDPGGNLYFRSNGNALDAVTTP